MKRERVRMLAAAVTGLAVAALVAASPNSARAGMDADVRAGVYPSADAVSIGGGVLTGISHAWYFNPNVEYAFAGDNNDVLTVNGDVHYDFFQDRPYFVWAGAGPALIHTERAGSVRVSAGPDGESVRFTVADTGEGIPAESLPRVFEKFYRAPGSRSKGGAGLGLAIAREIVAAHGGQIDAASRPGAGTTFTFRLPVARDPGGSDPRGGADP